jgi:hypothetical protein
MPVCHGCNDGRSQCRRSMQGTGQGTGSPTRARRGNNHGRGLGAIGTALVGACAAWLLGAGLMLAAPAALAQDAEEEAPIAQNPLVQRNVPAEATAENAVVARDRALASGQRIAYDRMASALGLSKGLSDQQIEGMVASLVIESERITPRGYSARITVNFRPPSGVARGMAAAPPPVPGQAPQGGPAVASVEAIARYRSLPEYAELTQRLTNSGAVARMDVVTVAGDMARLRLGLRSPPAAAASELAESGVMLAPGDPRFGEGWRIGLGAR